MKTRIWMGFIRRFTDLFLVFELDLPAEVADEVVEDLVLLQAERGVAGVDGVGDGVALVRRPVVEPVEAAVGDHLALHRQVGDAWKRNVKG